MKTSIFKELTRYYTTLKVILGNEFCLKKKKTLSLETYTDTDYASSLVDRRPTTKYCTFFKVIWNNGEARIRMQWQGHLQNKNLGLVLNEYMKYSG
jgi:hypothetical protein